MGQAISKTKYKPQHNHEKLKPRTKMALKWSMMNITHPIANFSPMKDHKYPSFCRLDMSSHKNIPCIHVHGKWDNNNKQNGVQIRVTSEGKLTNYCVKTKHIPNTSSKTKDIKEVMTLFQQKSRMKRRQQ